MGFPAQIVVYKDTQKHGFRNTGDRLLVYGNMKFKQLLFCRGLNTIKLVLDRFRESRFAANQVDKLFSSLFNVSFRTLRLVKNDARLILRRKLNGAMTR